MSTVFSIAGKDYDVLKKGRPQANQVAELGRWMATHGVKAYKAVEEDDSSGGLEMVASVLASLSADALIELFIVVFGTTNKVADEEFDAALLLEGALALYNESPTIKAVIERFFSNSTATDGEEDSSTQSDPPTDG
jgi:dihydroorotase